MAIFVFVQARISNKATSLARGKKALVENNNDNDELEVDELEVEAYAMESSGRKP